MEIFTICRAFLINPSVHLSPEGVNDYFHFKSLSRMKFSGRPGDKAVGHQGAMQRSTNLKAFLIRASSRGVTSAASACFLQSRTEALTLSNISSARHDILVHQAREMFLHGFQPILLSSSQIGRSKVLLRVEGQSRPANQTRYYGFFYWLC